MDEKKNLEVLFEKFLHNECTEEEFDLLIRYYDTGNKTALEQLIKKELTLPDETQAKTSSGRGKRAGSYGKMSPAMRRPVRRSTFKSLPRVLVAVGIVLFLAGGLWYYKGGWHVNKEEVLASKFGDDVRPGGNKAILTLGDGTRLSLTELSGDVLSQETGVGIIKPEAGQLAYSPGQSNANTAEPIYHTIETPRGGQYRITLPDGTRVWLNAASSLQYPVHFTGPERIVELSGEAYFEVHENKAMPFKVVSNGQTVEALGTHFNIRAYPEDKEMHTTLIEGQVRVEKGKLTGLLQPGEQAIVDQDFQIEKVDLTEVLAWKNGLIQFSNANIQEVMRKLTRWYDVEVVYQGEPIKTGFGGSVSRTKNISEILNLLELTGDVHFKIEGRRVIVMP